MNVENLRKLRDVIVESETYRQDEWAYGDCGTPACIAGHAAVLAGAKDLCRDGYCHHPYHTAISYVAANWLDLTADEAGDMFVSDPMGYAPVEKRHALAMLDIAIATGEVHWPKSEVIGDFDERELGR